MEIFPVIRKSVNIAEYKKKRKSVSRFVDDLIASPVISNVNFTREGDAMTVAFSHLDVDAITDEIKKHVDQANVLSGEAAKTHLKVVKDCIHSVYDEELDAYVYMKDTLSAIYRSLIGEKPKKNAGVVIYNQWVNGSLGNAFFVSSSTSGTIFLRIFDNPAFDDEYAALTEVTKRGDSEYSIFEKNINRKASTVLRTIATTLDIFKFGGNPARLAFDTTIARFINQSDFKNYNLAKEMDPAFDMDKLKTCIFKSCRCMEEGMDKRPHTGFQQWLYFEENSKHSFSVGVKSASGSDYKFTVNYSIQTGLFSVDMIISDPDQKEGEISFSFDEDYMSVLNLCARSQEERKL
jgi:hypothetical protein